jgi:hypothetical protein
MVTFLRLEKIVEINIQLGEYTFVHCRAVFLHRIMGRIFGGAIFMVLLLYCGLRGMEGSDDCGRIIPLEEFILVRVLNDTIPAHWKLVTKTEGFGHWVGKKVCAITNASLTRQHVMIRNYRSLEVKELVYLA